MQFTHILRSKSIGIHPGKSLYCSEKNGKQHAENGRHSRSPRSGLRYRIWSNQATFRLVTLNPYSLRNLRVS